MALGTNIFYYKEGTFEALNAQAPFTDPLTWGHFVRATDTNTDYWIEPGTGELIERKVTEGTAYSWFLKDAVGGSREILNTDSVFLLDGLGIDADIATLGAGSYSMQFGITGHGTANPGQILTRGATPSSVTYVNPLTVAAGSSSYLSINGSNELSVSNLTITQPYASAETSLANFISNDAQYASIGQGDIVILSSSGGTYIHNGGTAGTSADFFLVSTPASGIQSFTLGAGDGGAATTITDGETIDFVGGLGMATATFGNAVHIGLNATWSTIYTSIPTTPGAYYVAHNGNGTFTYATVDSLGSFDDFTIAGDTGTPNTIVDGETFTVAGGVGIDTAVTVNTITASLDSQLQTSVTNRPVAITPHLLVYTNGVYDYELADDYLLRNLENKNQTFTAERLVSFTGGSLTFTSAAGASFKLEDNAYTATLADVTIASSARGLILTAPNATQYRITVNNIGALTSTPV